MRIVRKRKKAAIKQAQEPNDISEGAQASLPRFDGSLLALESRMMFDGAAAATAGAVTTEQIAQNQVEATFSSSETGDTALAVPTGQPLSSGSDQALFDALSAYDSATARREVLFVSTGVNEYDRLLDGISPNVEVIVLDSTRDGVAQITEALAGRKDLDAIHILSHGAEAELMLGSSRLTMESMNSIYADKLAAIGQSLVKEADLLIYGCNFGQGELGQQAAGRLAELTGADVAVSTDATGHVDLGGDWQLEHYTGDVESAVAVSDGAMREWRGLLSEVIIESYEPAFADMVDNDYEIKSDQAWGQTFLYDSPGATYQVNRIGLVLHRDVVAASQVLTVSLLSSWNGAVIASGQISSDSIGLTEAWVHVDLTTPATLADNATYYIKVESDTLAGQVYVGVHDAGIYGSGDLINTSGVAETPKDMAFRIIEVNANAAPVIVGLSGDNLAYAEGDGSVVIEQGMTATVSDADSADFDSGTLVVSFVAGNDAAEDVLAIQNQGTGAGQIGVIGNTITHGGITIGSFAGGTGGNNLVVTFNGNVTPAVAQALIQNITYENTDTNNPTTGVRTVRFILTDGDGGSSGSHDTTVTVSGVNDGPTITALADQTIAEDGTTGALPFTVSDVETAAGSLTVTATSSNPILIPNGNLTLVNLGGGNWTLAAAPALNQSGGPVTITVTVSDGTTTTSETFDVTVTAVNDAPVASVPGPQTVNEDTALALSGVSVADVDGNLAMVQLGVGNGTVTVTLQGGATISAGANGTTTLTLAGTQADLNATLATLVYQGALNYSGPETLTIVSADVGSAVDVDTMTITINPVNDAPVLSSARITMAENQTGVTSITSTDVDGSAPIYSIVGGADAALVTLNAITGALTFNNATNFEAPGDTNLDNIYNVVIQVADGNGGIDVQTLNIAVTDVVEGLPPTTPLLTGGSPPAGPSSPLPRNVAGPSVGSLSDTQTSVAPGWLDASLNSSMPSTSEAPIGAANEDKKALEPIISPVAVVRDLQGFFDDGVTTRMPQADEGIRKSFGEQTPGEVPALPISEAFRTTLTLVEDDLRQATEMSETRQQFMIRAANMGGVTLTAGVITWLLRSGFLLASLTATLPAWRQFDPLPVVLVGGRERRKQKADMAAAAEHENKRFHGLKGLLDQKGDDKERSDGGGLAA